MPARLAGSRPALPPHAPLTPLPAIRPAHALYFAAYEAAKEALGGGGEGHHPFAVAAAGVFATITSDACMTPFDVVKQRLQARPACATSASLRPSRPVPQRRAALAAGGPQPLRRRVGLRVAHHAHGGRGRVLQVVPNHGAAPPRPHGAGACPAAAPGCAARLDAARARPRRSS